MRPIIAVLEEIKHGAPLAPHLKSLRINLVRPLHDCGDADSRYSLSEKTLKTARMAGSVLRSVLETRSSFGARHAQEGGTIPVAPIEHLAISREFIRQEEVWFKDAGYVANLTIIQWDAVSL